MSANIGTEGYQELNQTNLQNAIDTQFGAGKATVIDNGDGTFTVSFIGSKKDYNITSSGIQKGINWNDAMKQAIAPSSQDEERNNNVIGIGTDGQPVDMDLWEYTLMDNGTYGLNDTQALQGTGTGRSAGYLGSYTEDGQIIGKIPQYISINNGKTYRAVSSMAHTFYDCDNLIIAPDIPSTITNMQVTFYQASELTTAPKNIPSSVKNLSYTFSDCRKLNTVPTLNNGIEDMTATFRYTAIKKFSSKIPNTVKNMFHTFYGCTNLEQGPKEIPASVNNMINCFMNCAKLEGIIEINAIFSDDLIYASTYTGYASVFNNACQNGSGLIVKGKSNKLSALAENNSKISIEQ